MACHCILFVAILTVSLTPWLSLLLPAVFLSGLAEASIFLLPLLFLLESVGSEHRHWYLSIPLGVTGVLAGGFAFAVSYTSNWRLVCQIQAGVTVLSLLLYIWLYESPRYFSISGQFESARRSLQRISRYNKHPPFQEVLEGEKVLGFQEQSSVLPSSPKSSPNEVFKLNFVNTSHGTVTVTDSISPPSIPFTCGLLFQLPSFRRKLIPVIFMWCAQGVTYTCVRLQLGNTLDSRYVMEWILGVTGAFTILLTVGCMRKIGRKPCIEWVMFIGGLACWAGEIATIAEETVVKAVFLVLASGMMTSLQMLLCVYTCELFPTCLRLYALCSVTSIAYLLSLFSPYISLLASYLGIDILLILGTFLLASCLLGLEMPETQGKRLEDFFEESLSRQIEMKMNSSSNNFPKKQNFEHFNEA